MGYVTQEYLISFQPDKFFPVLPVLFGSENKMCEKWENDKKKAGESQVLVIRAQSLKEKNFHFSCSDVYPTMKTF